MESIHRLLLLTLLKHKSLSKLDDFMNQLYTIYLQVKKEGITQVS